MRAAFFTKGHALKHAFIHHFVAEAGTGQVIYIYPKNRRKEAATIPGAYAVSYEDVTKTEHWLRVNGLVGPDTILVLENPSRYPKITSEKFRHLYRLCMNVEHRAIVDIVPFTLDVKYLYTPYCYLGRDILGYSHYYAFRENYHEMDEDGNVHAAHDFDVLAAKMAPVSTITYPAFLCPSRQTIEFEETEEEQAAYAARKAELFDEEKSPQRIITRLADTTHAFESRRAALLDLLPTLAGDTIVYTNLGTYAKRLQQAVRAAGFRRVWATSYQTGSRRPVQNCIYFESPIVKSYYLLDAESRLDPGTRVFHFLGTTGVDRYLYGELVEELEQIDGLTKELYRETKEKSQRLQALLAQDRPRGSTGEDRLDLRLVRDGERFDVGRQGQLSFIRPDLP